MELVFVARQNGAGLYRGQSNLEDFSSPFSFGGSFFISVNSSLSGKDASSAKKQENRF